MAKQVRKEQAVVDLVINGRAAESSIKGIQKATFETEKLLRNMSKAANPEEYAKLRGELIKLKAAQTELNSELRVQEGLWTKFKSNISQIALGTVGGNVFAALGAAAANALPKAIDKVADLSDAVANVRKTTGLAKDEVLDLFDSFSEIDTRTTSAELRELAAMAGKLGEDTQEGVKGFVKGADIINVALKEDLGGSAEEAINKVGKLISIFDLKEEFGIEQSFVKVGSVINELGGKSAASEEYIVNFTTRLAGIAPAARITISEVMGLAAVMDEQGQSTELAATNIGKMLISLGKDIPYFAKIAGMGVKDFTTLLNTNANEALLKVVERAKQSEGGLGNLAKTFKTLGIDGAEGAAVIGALANNIDRVREQQAIANAEFVNGTSIMNEYNIKNNNSAAIWEKVTRKVESFLSSAFRPLGEAIIDVSGRLFGVVSEFDRVSEALDNQKRKVNQLDKELVPLLAKYDDLVLQAAQGKDVQKELNTVIGKIADVMPSAVTSWDQYGNAVDINTAKAKAAIEDHKAMMKYLNQETIKELEQLKKSNEARYADTLRSIQNGRRQVNMGMGMYRDVALSEAEINKERKNLEELIKKRNELNAALNGFYGEHKYNTGPAAATPGAGKDNKGGKEDNKGGNVTGGGSSSASEKLSKEAKDLERLKGEIFKLRDDLRLNALEQDDREIEAARLKYKALKELAHGNTDYIKQLDELEKAELAQLEEKHTKKLEEENQKRTKKAEEEAEKRKADALKKMQEEVEERERFAAEERKKAAEGEKAMGDFQSQVKSIQRSRIKSKISEEAEQADLDALEEKYKATRSKLEASFNEAILAAPDNMKNAMAKMYGDALLDIERGFYEESDKLQEDYMLRRMNSWISLATNVSDIFASLMEITSDNATEFAEFQKILAVVQLTVDTALAVAQAIKGGIATGVTPLEKIISVTSLVAFVLGNMAKAKQILSKADTPAAPQYQRLPGRESGGSTDLLSLYLDNNKNPQGYINRPTLFNLGERSWIGGEKFKQEYVFSNAMLQNPIFARFAAMAETLRTSGYDFTKNPDMAPGSGGASAELLPYLQILIAETQRNREAVEQFSKKPWSLRRFEDAQELLDYARNNSKA